MPRWRSRCGSTSWSVLRLAIRLRSSSVVRIASSLSRSSASRLAERTVSGSATAAVTSTEISATTHVTTTARTVSVLLRIRGVPDAAHRPDDRGRVAELGPDLGDMDVDGPGAGVCRVPPDAGQQLLPGEHPAGPLHEVGEQVELGRGQVDQVAGGPDLPAAGVEGQRPE